MQRSSCPFALALALASISLYRSLLFVVVGVGKIKARIKRGKCKKNISMENQKILGESNGK